MAMAQATPQQMMPQPQEPGMQGNSMGQGINMGGGVNAPGAPTQAQTNQFLPGVLSAPYTQGMSTAVNQGNFFGAATPAAAQFQQSLYSPSLSPMNQSYLQAAGQLGQQQLQGTQNNLMGMYENSASSSGLAPAMLQAANQQSAQLGTLAGQMAQQQTQQATQTLPFTAGFPIQANQAAQQAGQGLYNGAQQAMYGDSSFPLATLGSTPFSAPSVIAQAPSSSGKSK